MKQALFLIFGCIVIISSKAQWTTSGNNIYNSNTGNVGIGNTSPSAKLHIGPTAGYGTTTGLLFTEPLTGNTYDRSVQIAPVQTAAASGNSLLLYLVPTIASGVTQNTQYGLVVESKQGSGSISNYYPGVFMGGNVGIGTYTPDQLLTLNAGSGANSLVSFKQNATTAAYVGLGTDGVFRNQTLSGTELQLRADGASNFVSLYTNTTEKMRVTASGNVGIGTSSPNSNAKLDVNGNIFSNGKIAIGTTDMAKISTYSLAVNGDAMFNKVKVKQYMSWPDYVFHKSYPLLPLKELERFIQENNHLPDVPSSSEVEKDGLDIGDNQALLLKKIEELTLYAIEQNKKIEEQGKKIEKLEEQMKNK